MSNRKSKSKKTKLTKKVIVNLNSLKNIDDLKRKGTDLGVDEKDKIQGGKDTANGQDKTADPQWPVTTGNC